MHFWVIEVRAYFYCTFNRLQCYLLARTTPLVIVTTHYARFAFHISFSRFAVFREKGIDTMRVSRFSFTLRNNFSRSLISSTYRFDYEKLRNSFREKVILTIQEITRNAKTRNVHNAERPLNGSVTKKIK